MIHQRENRVESLFINGLEVYAQLLLADLESVLDEASLALFPLLLRVSHEENVVVVNETELYQTHVGEELDLFLESVGWLHRIPVGKNQVGNLSLLAERDDHVLSLVKQNPVAGHRLLSSRAH